MAIARVTEIISSSKKGFDDAGVQRNQAGLQDVKQRIRSLGAGSESCCRKRRDRRIPRDPQSHFRIGRLDETF